MLLFEVFVSSLLLLFELSELSKSVFELLLFEELELPSLLFVLFEPLKLSELLSLLSSLSPSSEGSVITGGTTGVVS